MTRRFLIPMLAWHLLLGSALHAKESVTQDSWENLNRVTHRRSYTFVDGSSNCVAGQISSLTDQGVTVKGFEWNAGNRQWIHPTKTMDRKDVIRVVEVDPVKPICIVYSGRSSWADVQAVREIDSDDEACSAREAVLVITKDGKHHKGKPTDISEEHISLKHGNKIAQFPKRDISRVYYFREKPVSAGAEYAAQELDYLLFLDPETWPYILGYMLHIRPKLQVLLYDSATPEDDSTVQCNKPSRGQSSF